MDSVWMTWLYCCRLVMRDRMCEALRDSTLISSCSAGQHACSPGTTMPKHDGHVLLAPATVFASIYVSKPVLHFGL